MPFAMFRILSFPLIACACLLAVSCTQQHHDTMPVGVMTNIETGKIVSVKKIKIDVKKSSDGTFSSMAGSAAQAVTPGFFAEGTSRIASATAGSLMDSKVDYEDAIRARIMLDNGESLIEIIQLAKPNTSFKVGQKVFITKGSTPANLWPE